MTDTTAASRAAEAAHHCIHVARALYGGDVAAARLWHRHALAGALAILEEMDMERPDIGVMLLTLDGAARDAVEAAHSLMHVVRAEGAGDHDTVAEMAADAVRILDCVGELIKPRA